MICQICGNLIDDCECEVNQSEECDDDPISNDIGETDYDGDVI